MGAFHLRNTCHVASNTEGTLAMTATPSYQYLLQNTEEFELSFICFVIEGLAGRQLALYQ